MNVQSSVSGRECVGPVVSNALTKLLGCRYPIMASGMGGVSRYKLAEAVSNAGGFGVLGMVREPVGRIVSEVTLYRQCSECPVAVNLIPAATDNRLLADQVNALIALKVEYVVLFWDVDRELISRLRSAGIVVICQVGSIEDIQLALRAEADALIVQGWEAGGHIRGTAALFSLLPVAVKMSPVPVIASGGISTGAGIAACIRLGAQGVSLGTAFVATHESNAHDLHKRRIVAANVDDTIYTHRFYLNWPMAAPVRVLENSVTRGEYDFLRQCRKTPEIGMQDGKPVLLFSTDSPLADATGDINAMPIYAGQSCGGINSLVGARDRLNQLIKEWQVAND